MAERLIGIPARDAREDVWRSGRDLDDSVDRMRRERENDDV